MTQAIRKEESGLKNPRQKGNARPMWGFRPPTPVQEFIDGMRGERSANIVELLEQMIELRQELGDDWGELLRQAYVAQVGPGRIAARLAKSALKRR